MDYTSEDEIIKVLGDRAFDEAVQRAYTRGRNAFLNEFAIDGTGIPCDTLVERDVAMKKRLVKDTEGITILTRLITNTVRAVMAHTNKISTLV